MLIPILITGGILGALVWSARSTTPERFPDMPGMAPGMSGVRPVGELTRGKRYSIRVDFDSKQFPVGSAADLDLALRTEIPTALQEGLVMFGFPSPVLVREPQGQANGIYTYWYDATWNRDVTPVEGVELHPWVDVEFYPSTA